jgi:hypothetical protein
MMIKNREHKVKEIVLTIKTRISDINKYYRKGPELYFYKRLIFLRNNSDSVESFLKSDYHFEILYATLVSWDMNSRCAKMKYFDEFKANILSCINQFKEIERLGEDLDIAKLKPILMKTYEELNLMKTSGKLVSNSKLLHFLFPNLLMPMDRANTLTYVYGNMNESVNKYIEIIDFSFEIMKQPLKWNYFLDNEWSTTVPKIIDNAIILLVGKSLKM